MGAQMRNQAAYGMTGALLVGLLLAIGNPCLAQEAETRSRTLELGVGSEDWVEVAPPPPGTPAGDLYQIKLLLKDEEYSDAWSASEDFLELHGTQNTAYPSLLIARATAQIGRRNFDRAHEILQEYLSEFQGFGETPEALRLEFVIAETYLTGVKRKWLGMRILPSEDAAFEILDDVSTGYPDSIYAPLALKTKADYLYAEGEYLLAEMEYARLVREHPLNRYHQVALRRTAESALASFGGTSYDDAALVEAGERYRDYRSRYPEAAQQEQVDVILQGISAQRALKELEIARYYERTDHYGSAIFYYERVVKYWPDSVAAAQARERLELLGKDVPTASSNPSGDAEAASTGSPSSES
jgi:outer membrane protein assembly factor BamD (BamD/ComL family)